MQSNQNKPSKRPDFLPLWVFIAIVLAVLFVSFAGPQQPPDRSGGRIIPVNSAKSITSIIGPGDAHAGACGYCGWYSLCDNNTRYCCTQWISTGCGGGGSSDNPPTINGAVTCGQTGQNGWCVSNPQLNLTASDPQGYTVTISGTLNLTNFNCGSSCTQNLSKGTGTANYTVTAATSGMTASGSSNWSYDPDPPVPSLGLNGTSGTNGWYTSVVTATAGGSDVISGLASAVLSLDGGSASPSASIAVDGVHTVNETATDKAGNSASTSASVKVDTTAPQISAVGVTGTPGPNGWYISPVQLSATASDATSGLASLKINVDGVWSTFAGSKTLGDGQHTVQFQATDNAGNVSTTMAQQYKVDTTAPVVAPVITGTSGSNGWYTSSVQVSASATDSVSGINALDIAVDGGAWSVYTAPISLSDGEHTVKFQASDNAGNPTSTTLSVKVDTTAPTVTPLISGTNGTNGWFTSAVQLSANTTDNGSGISSTQVSVDSGAWQSITATIATEGQHSAILRAYDNAGNTASSSASFKIDTIPPAITQSLTGTQGSNGWYVSTVTASATASDAGSGVASFQHRVDGGTWQSGDTAILSDGMHTIDFQVPDQAGNVQSVSESAKVDTTKPQIKFASALSGVPLSGNVALSGTATDPVSGLSSVEVSTDNGTTWQHAASFLGGEWRLTWPTGNLSNGAYTVFLRAGDNAGNQNSTNIGLIIDNNPPSIGLSGWTFPAGGYVKVAPSVWPIASVKVSVNDPAGLWSDKIFSSNQSGTLMWSGKLLLFPGAYPLRAEVCDIYGLCSKTESAVLVNVSPTATPTAIPTATEKPAPLTIQRPPTLVPTKNIPTPQQVATPTLQPASTTPAPAQPTETPFAPVAVGALTLLSAALLILDPRPRAWRNLTLTASQAIKKQEEDKQ